MSDDPVTRLAADARASAAARRRVPASTYRLQLHGGFKLADATRLVPYLHALGVTDVYTSNLLAARAGSTHGYDAIDHSRLNDELGTEADLERFAAALHARGMGLVLDVVPNHMAAVADNPWWADVLEHGPASAFAGHFDIAWDDHPRDRLRGRVLLPVLGEPYGEALEAGRFVPVLDAGWLFLELYGKRLPVDPRTYHLVLGPATAAVRDALGPDEPGLLELQSILTAVQNLPPRSEADPGRLAVARAESAVIKRRLAELSDRHPEAAALVQAAVNRLAGTPGDAASFADLDALLDAQAYRPAFWRVASDEINYRRFFDVNELAALSMEREDVFRAAHETIFDWIAGGVVDGLRIDHPDGLFDPRQYLDQLQAFRLLAEAKKLLAERPDDYAGPAWADAEPRLLADFAADPGRTLYVVVEKILGHGERLPDEWRTDGTTGYEVLNAINGLFVDAAGDGAMTAAFVGFTGVDDPFDELVYRNKQLALRTLLASELHVLAHQLDRLAQMRRGTRDFTLNGLRHALREVIACFPVYRTYVNDGVSDTEKRHVVRAVRQAKRRNPTLGDTVFKFIRDTLLLVDPADGPLTDEYVAARARFAGKFEQVTAPVTAKGIEDTAFYVYNRLVSLNEVGGEPGHFGRPPDLLHRFLVERAAHTPGGLTPLATHDTKRGEDVRARLNVLSEMPAEWSDRVRRWADWNRPHKVETEEGVTAPDANEEYLLYQTLVAALPWDATDLGPFADRVKPYMNKALHEAKVHSSWINPDAEYDAAVGRFIGRILDPEQSADFVADLRAFAADVARYGAVNSLAQTLLKCVVPGVPDTYQGCELWDLNLVDPDNRRPVDFPCRERLLAYLDRGDAGDVLADAASGVAKLFVTSRALRARRDHPDLFGPGAYLPLEATGAKADCAFAFARTTADRAAVVVVPRLPVRLLGSPDRQPLGPDVWGDTAVELPAGLAGRTWANAFTGERLADAGGRFALADVFATFPVALLLESDHL